MPSDGNGVRQRRAATQRSGGGGLVRADAALVRCPAVAWPTVALTLAAHALLWPLVLGACYWHVNGAPLAQPARLLLQAAVVVLQFVQFTPMHDAAHRSLAKRSPLLNEALGHAAAAALLTPFDAFRFVHLLHHRHTNDADNDPDHFSTRGAIALLPFRWVVQDYVYIYHVLRRWRTVGSRVRISMAAYLALLLGLTWWLNAAPLRSEAFWTYYEWPRRLTLVLLVWSFDYAPHRPGTPTSAANRYAATSKLGGVTRVADARVDRFSSGLDWLLSGVLLNQHLHIVHHLWPQVPFYGYGGVWRSTRAELVERGTRIEPLIDRKRPWW